MKGVLTAALAATALAVAACNEQDGAGRPLGLVAAVDSSGDSIPGPKPGPVASVTVSPESATVAVGDSAGFFADLRDATGNPARDANVRWSGAHSARPRWFVPWEPGRRSSQPRAKGRAGRGASWYRRLRVRIADFGFRIADLSCRASTVESAFRNPQSAISIHP